MPLQIWTGDQRPQLMLAGAQALGGGISSGVKSLSDSLAQAMEARKQENAQAKASEALFTNTPELQQALNIDPETFKGLSARDKTEMVRAGLGKLTLMDTLRRNQEEAEARRMREVDYSKRRASEEAFNTELAGQPKPDLMNTIGAAARHGQLLNPQMDNLLRSLAAGQSAGPVVLPPGFVPKNVSVGADGRPTYSYGPARGGKPLLDDYPWLYDDDMEKVKQGIRGIKDPEQRSLAIKERNDFEVMKGRPGLLEQLLLSTKKASAAPEPAAQQWKRGDKVKQNGVIYEFDGSNWKASQ